ncbi:MAG TPA: amino acid ABC transporter permease [Geminicoccus sp.]|jgi:polar amino acid transport system permease protein|uniref:amino acid ABC transporter permease n=1 Tax=Geminicoccus sp. TaxID=2024832 RepID=UPI002E34A98F|nr:amino acid ABC transporter permease [Geminicoccus sp.]HEX2526967.1 amino acid ABC transporter permease [Geminicoccus sp.]
MERGTFLYEIWIARWSLLSGFGITVSASVLTIVIASICGMILGVALSYGWRPLRWLIRLYVDVLRGIPVLVLILFTYYGLALFKINVAPFWAGVIALGAFSTAHIAETIRGGIQSIPHGQMEAAKSIGLQFHQRLAHVIVPLAIRRVLPPWMNTCAEIVKNTTLLSIIGVVEFLLANQQAIARNYLILHFYLFATLIYLLLNFSISQVGAALERRYAHLRY